MLLIAGVLAIAALWLLARFRFPNRPVTPNPVPAVLGQLATGPKFDDLAGEIVQLQTRLQLSLVALDDRSTVRGSVQMSRRAAVRMRDDLVVTWGSPASNRNAAIVAHDPASGLAVARMTSSVTVSPPSVWTPRQLQQPRYLVASDVSPDRVSLRPVFVGSLDPIDSPWWSEPLWAVPERTDLAPGVFLFTTDAELVGLVIGYDGRMAIMPGATILAEADRLSVATPSGAAGTIAVEVQDLTAPVASVTGARAGVVVSWVDADVASTGQLMAGDVIESIDGQTLATRHQWDMRVARLSVGETVTLRVRRRGELRVVALVANAPAPQELNPTLGLTLRERANLGAEVLRVERASAADRAGLIAGDVITLVAEISAPTPAQVVRSFASTNQGERVIVAVTRGDVHFVSTLER